VDLVRSGDRDEAVVLFDRAVRGGLTTLDDVREAVAGMPPCRGSAQAAWVVQEADGLAESSGALCGLTYATPRSAW
jgi:hypothetical protein